MKINEVKHNHSLTDLLKILLFSLLMLAPIGSVATRCLYVICNKNAKDSYSKENVATRIETYNLYTNAEYFYQYVNDTTGQTNNTTGMIPIDSISVDTPQNTAKIRFTNSNSITCYDSNESNIGYVQNINNCTFKVSADTTIINQPWYNNYVLTTSNNTLDNVFEYSVEKLANDQIYSWTQNTPVYTGINAMCTQLGITGQAIPIILSYWLILTCIYVVIDIVLKLFTLLTHLIANRKAG